MLPNCAFTVRPPLPGWWAEAPHAPRPGHGSTAHGATQQTQTHKPHTTHGHTRPHRPHPHTHTQPSTGARDSTTVHGKICFQLT